MVSFSFFIFHSRLPSLFFLHPLLLLSRSRFFVPPSKTRLRSTKTGGNSGGGGGGGTLVPRSTSLSSPPLSAAAGVGASTPPTSDLPRFDEYRVRGKSVIFAPMFLAYLPTKAAAMRLVESLRVGMQEERSRHGVAVIGTLTLLAEHLKRARFVEPLSVALLALMPFLQQHLFFKKNRWLKCSSIPFAVAMFQIENGGRRCTLAEAAEQAAKMGLPAFALPKTMNNALNARKKSAASGYTCSWALDDRLHVVDEGREGRERYLSLRVICPCSNMRGAAGTRLS